MIALNFLREQLLKKWMPPLRNSVVFIRKLRRLSGKSKWTQLTIISWLNGCRSPSLSFSLTIVCCLQTRGSSSIICPSIANNPYRRKRRLNNSLPFLGDIHEERVDLNFSIALFFVSQISKCLLASFLEICWRPTTASTKGNHLMIYLLPLLEMWIFCGGLNCLMFPKGLSN